MKKKPVSRLQTQTMEIKPERIAERYKRSQNYQKQFLMELSEIVHQTDFMVDLTKAPPRKQPAWMGQTIKRSKIVTPLPENEEEYQKFLSQDPKITSKTIFVQTKPCSDDEYQNIEESEMNNEKDAENPNNSPGDKFIWEVELDEQEDVLITKVDQTTKDFSAEEEEEEEEKVAEHADRNNATEGNSIAISMSQSIPTDGEAALAKVFALIEEEEDVGYDSQSYGQGTSQDVAHEN